MGLGNMITRLFTRKEEKNKTDATDIDFNDIDSIIPSPKNKRKSLLISKTINFYSDDSYKTAKKKSVKTADRTE